MKSLKRGKQKQTDSFGCIGAGVHLGTRHVLGKIQPFFRRNRDWNEALLIQFGLRGHERGHQGD